MTEADKQELENLRRQNAQLLAQVREQSDVIDGLQRPPLCKDNVVDICSAPTSNDSVDVIEPFITAMVNKYRINQYQCTFLRSFITSYVESA